MMAAYSIAFQFQCTTHLFSPSADRTSLHLINFRGRKKPRAMKKPQNVSSSYMTPKRAIYFVALNALMFCLSYSCKSESTKVNYDSSNIEEVDTCLLGMTIKSAIAKLTVDTSQFFAFDEPPGILRGIKITIDNEYEIALEVERTSIIGQSKYSFREQYKYIEDKTINAVSWTNLTTKQSRSVSRK